MKYKDRIRSLPRLEFNALVQNTTAQVCSMGKHCRIEEAKDNLVQLRSGRFHSEIMSDTAAWNDRKKYMLDLRAAIVLTVIYEVAVRKGIKLPEQFKEIVDHKQSKHVEELPKEKPSIGESFGLLRHTRDIGGVQITRTVDVPISRGFRTDLARSQEEFDELFGQHFTVGQAKGTQAKCSIKEGMEKHVKYALNYGATSEQLRKSLDKDLKKFCLSKRKYLNSAHGHTMLKQDMEMEYDKLMFDHHTTPSKSYFAEALADIEQRIYATTYPAFATGEALDKLSEIETAPLEKPMQNLEITKPILVGRIDILTCCEDTLVGIIRDAKEQIKLNADIAEVSTSYAKKADKLEKVIGLCVAQLDKRFK